jgi:bifunctional DNA-binding transcriptional regulator/antitoxin component of YhaV-PrlF toxin-antitoxin module
LQFDTTLALDGATATGIPVPADVIEALGGAKRIPVSVTINGVTYSSTVATMKGQTRIPVSAAIRAQAGIAAGDAITVVVERDDAPRTVEVPEDLLAALSEEAAVKSRFDALSYSHQKQHVLSVTDAKTAETRARRIQKVLEKLSA